MRIGTCDDNPSDAQKIAFALADISPGIHMTCYETGSALLEAAKDDAAFDLVFLDIYLKQENGMEIAEQLRRVSPNTEIVFSTVSRDFAVEAFRVQAADYLVKPYTEADVVMAFARANLRHGNRKYEGVLLRLGRQMRVFHPEEVMKIESDRHYTRLTAVNGEETRIHSPYSEIAPRFPDVFIEIRRGLSVNMAFIDGIEGDVITMTDGGCYAVARARLDEVINTFTRFVQKA